MPEPTTSDQADAVIGQYVAALQRVAEAAHNLAGDAPGRDQLLTGLAGIAALAVDSLQITPDQLDVRHEYSISWHGDGRDDAVRLASEKPIGHLARALREAPMKVGSYGITHFTIDFRTWVHQPDGSSWCSGWQKIDFRGDLITCTGCGATVFRAGPGGERILDADPDPDGPLVIVPSPDHGGMPSAVYGEPARPGQKRYRAHTCPVRP